MRIGRQLIVNADDFGFTAGVNRGIVRAHCEGILTATTLMANGAAFDQAMALARENPALDVGVHLVLVGGRSLVPPHRLLPASVAGLLFALATRRMRIYDELAAQVNRVLEAGVSPSHLDTHKHTHLAPPVLDAVCRVAEDFRIPWVRRPFDLPLTAAGVPWPKRAANHALGLLRRRFHRVLLGYGCCTTDHFAGFQITGRLQEAELVSLAGQLPEGLTELMCHPGYCDAELRAARTRLKESREAELGALTSSAVKRALQEHGVRLLSYRDASR